MTTEVLNSVENVKCNEVAGAMYAFPRITLPKKAIETAKGSSRVSGLDFYNRTAEYYNGYLFRGRPSYANRPKQGNLDSGILGFGFGIQL